MSKIFSKKFFNAVKCKLVNTTRIYITKNFHNAGQFDQIKKNG